MLCVPPTKEYSGTSVESCFLFQRGRPAWWPVIPLNDRRCFFHLNVCKGSFPAVTPCLASTPNQPQVYGVNVVVSSSDGKVREQDLRTTVFKRNANKNYHLKMKASRSVDAPPPTSTRWFRFACHTTSSDNRQTRSMRRTRYQGVTQRSRSVRSGTWLDRGYE